MDSDQPNEGTVDRPMPDEGLPWYVKVALVVVVLAILFVVVVDLVEFAT